MSYSPYPIRFALALAGLTTACGSPRRTPVAAHAPPDVARLAYAHPLPTLDGSRLEARLVEVSYPPGGSSTPHSHPCAVIGYVVSGALRSRVNDEPESTYHAGQSFYEAPNSRHLVSANASVDEPVRFLAYFTCDRTTPLAEPLPAAGPGAQP